METKGFKPQNNSTISIIMCLFLITTGNLFAQNFKKTYKYLKSNDIEKATLAYNDIDRKEIKTYDNVVIFGIAGIILSCNEKYENYNPYNALESFNKITKMNADFNKVNKFLHKYDLTYEKTQDIIYNSIAAYAKKINTEAEYSKALSVCNDCFYKRELLELKEKTAFKKTKQDNSIETCNRFISSYPNSNYLNEIKDLLNDLSFNEAKSKMTVQSMNNYLSKFNNNNNKYFRTAIHIRDSIAFSKLSRNYFDYKNFMNEYPTSEYSTVINEQLPELLISQAQSTKDIKLYELFFNNYPNSNQIENVKSQLEYLYFLELTKNPSINNYEKYKKRFPESNYISKLSEIYSKILENNDLNRDNLKGAVKSIEVITYYPKEYNREEEASQV